MSEDARGRRTALHSGRCADLPAAEVVLFPRTILPLHVFEPRYRAMMADALDGDRVISVALLKPGYEPLYYTPRAPIHPTVGVGKILESEQVADGTYNMLLRGVARATIVAEVPDRRIVKPRSSRCRPIAARAMSRWINCATTSLRRSAAIRRSTRSCAGIGSGCARQSWDWTSSPT